MSSRLRFKIIRRFDLGNKAVYLDREALFEWFTQLRIRKRNFEKIWGKNGTHEFLSPAAATSSTRTLGLKSLGNDNDEPRQTSRLCQSCCGIPSTGLSIESERVLHSDVESLIFSSRSCPLCRLVRYQLGGVLDRTTDGFVSSRVTLSAHRLRGRMWLDAYMLHMGELQLFADPGEFTAC